MQIHTHFSDSKLNTASDNLLNYLLLCETGNNHCVFIVLHTQNESVDALHAYSWQDSPSRTEAYKECLQNAGLHRKEFSKVVLSSATDESTLVPDGVFNESDAANYFKFNFDKEPVNLSIDQIIHLSARNVYNLPNEQLDFSDQFSHTKLVHSNTGMIEELLENHAKDDTTICVVHKDLLFISIASQGKLLLSNTFRSGNIEDLVYYTLYTHEKTDANIANQNIILGGDAYTGKFRDMLQEFATNLNQATLPQRFTYPIEMNGKEPLFYSAFTAFLCV